MVNPKSFLKESDLENILILLKTRTFSEVAKLYGYDTSSRNGGTGIRQFLQKHGHDPRQFTKLHGCPLNPHWGSVGGELVGDKPRVVAVYYENGMKITRYESRYARF